MCGARVRGLVLPSAARDSPARTSVLFISSWHLGSGDRPQMASTGACGASGFSRSSPRMISHAMQGIPSLSTAVENERTENATRARRRLMSPALDLQSSGQTQSVGLSSSCLAESALTRRWEGEPSGQVYLTGEGGIDARLGKFAAPGGDSAGRHRTALPGLHRTS